MLETDIGADESRRVNASNVLCRVEAGLVDGCRDDVGRVDAGRVEAGECATDDSDIQLCVMSSVLPPLILEPSPLCMRRFFEGRRLCECR